MASMENFAIARITRCEDSKISISPRPQSYMHKLVLSSHHSQVWRAILEGRGVLVQGLIRRIGNGFISTEIWNHSWLSRKELMRPIVSLAADPPHLGRSYWWNECCMENWRYAGYFPSDGCLTILQIPLCTRNIDDFWSWNFERSGVLFPRSGYHMLVSTKWRHKDWLEARTWSSNASYDGETWKSLWNTLCPWKIEILPVAPSFAFFTYQWCASAS